MFGGQADEFRPVLVRPWIKERGYCKFDGREC